MDDLISRQEAIDTLNDGAELLRRVLDDTDIVCIEREVYEWGLGLLESYISDMENLPSAQTEIIYCRDCKYWQSEEHIGNNNVHTLNIASLPCKNWLTGGDWYCGSAERRTDEGKKDLHNVQALSTRK